MDVETLLVSPSTLKTFNLSGANGKLPLMVIPHGGPHSCSTNSFSFLIASIVGLGMHCLMVNYTGSIGFVGTMP